MTLVKGDGGISAEIVADSISSNSGVRITTFSLIYPRFIHSEFMTHRLFSRNSASSRAIPTERLIDLVNENPARPVSWGKNKKGMQAGEQLSNDQKINAKLVWDESRKDAVFRAIEMNGLEVHKQVVNRLLEPHQFIKVICTATEYDNFFTLRLDKDAQPEIQELSWCMKYAIDKSKPTVLVADKWHVPYFQDGWWSPKVTDYSLSEALKISASCCAQVSFMRSDDSLSKAEAIYNKLIESKPMHASPFEHQATPITIDHSDAFLFEQDVGVTHMDLYGKLWSGNFKEWIQYRQTL